jgi:hypothetical protein
MNAWDSYQSRLDARGGSLRGMRLNRVSRNINRKVVGSLSYFSATVNGKEQELAIINSDHLNMKTICSLPGEDIIGGSLVFWSGNYWIVTERDVNNELYTKATMQQCNYLLKWIIDGTIVERWCIITDGTKYLTGETISSYNDNGMSLGDTRISMIISRDSITARLGRHNRFLIDDNESDKVLAYRLTKPFKLGSVFNNHGAMAFVLSEVNTEDDDNFELLIADYYKYFPRQNNGNSGSGGSGSGNTGEKEVWF